MRQTLENYRPRPRGLLKCVWCSRHLSAPFCQRPEAKTPRMNLSSPRTVLWAAFAILALSGGISIHQATRAGVTWDEPTVTYSGYAAWQGNYGWNREVPHLTKMIAT